MRTLLCLAFCTSLSFSSARGGELGGEKGSVTYKPLENAVVAERYKLDKYSFDFEMKPKLDLPNSGVEIYTVTFPSPVKCKFECNNTVHAEYYRPKGKGPFPGVIVLDILGGDQKLSRGIATLLAQNNISAMFVQMAYYGPRRPPEGVRLLTTNLAHTMEAIRQTVLDCRCATAWLESRPEVDGKRLGILGTSLGSFMSALTAEMEPRLGRVALFLGGGGLVDAYWDHPKAKPYTKVAELIGGGGKEQLKKLIAPADPLTYAENLKSRKLLMIAASRDDVVPPQAARTLWEATGKQRIIWYDTTHVGAALYLLDAIEAVVRHFGAE